MCDSGDLLDILQPAEEVRVLNDNARGCLVDVRLQLRNANLAMTSRQHENFRRLIGQISRDALHGFGIHGTGHDHAARSSGATHRHEHRLGDSTPSVVETRVGDIETAQLGDQRLEFKEGLQRSLTRLGLIRRVGGVELAASRHFINDARDVVIIGPAPHEADARCRPHIARGQLAQMPL